MVKTYGIVVVKKSVRRISSIRVTPSADLSDEAQRAKLEAIAKENRVHRQSVVVPLAVRSRIVVQNKGTSQKPLGHFQALTLLAA